MSGLQCRRDEVLCAPLEILDPDVGGVAQLIDSLPRQKPPVGRQAWPVLRFRPVPDAETPPASIDSLPAGSCSRTAQVDVANASTSAEALYIAG